MSNDERQSPVATSRMSQEVEAGDRQPDMGRRDDKKPVFKPLDVTKMKTPVIDAMNLTWGPVGKGVVVSHN